MRSALTATRAWKPLDSSGAASCSIHSATAAISSAASGRFCISALLEQGEQVVLGLRDAAADRGQLHAAGQPAQVCGGLRHAHDTPLERAVHLPEVQLGTGH